MLDFEDRKPMDIKQLTTTLGEALNREADLWKPLSYKTASLMAAATEIGGEQRNQAVRWLAQLTSKFHFMPETFYLSVNILDRFLQAVKARPKHLNCIGVAAFYLAAKTGEEDEMVPGTLEFVQESHCGCSMSEVLRMERCILDKLHWDLRATTPLHFLQIFHSLLMANCPNLLDGFSITTSSQLTALTNRLQSVVINTTAYLRYPPSVLALAILSLEMEKFWPNWYEATVRLAYIVQVEISVLKQCKQLVQQTSPYMVMPTGFIYVPTSTGRIYVTSGKRKADELDTDSEDEMADEEDIYDGIKRLYSEETAIEA